MRAGPRHAVRIVPMTPELRPILQALFDQAPEGSEAVVPRLTDPTTNLRTTFMKLIARAAGATDLDIHDTVLITAAFCMYNRYVEGLGTREAEEHEYEPMGRRLRDQGYAPDG
jgi:integrase